MEDLAGASNGSRGTLRPSDPGDFKERKTQFELRADERCSNAERISHSFIELLTESFYLRPARGKRSLHDSSAASEQPQHLPQETPSVRNVPLGDATASGTRA